MPSVRLASNCRTESSMTDIVRRAGEICVDEGYVRARALEAAGRFQRKRRRTGAALRIDEDDDRARHGLVGTTGDRGAVDNGNARRRDALDLRRDGGSGYRIRRSRHVRGRSREPRGPARSANVSVSAGSELIGSCGERSARRIVELRSATVRRSACAGRYAERDRSRGARCRRARARRCRRSARVVN